MLLVLDKINTGIKPHTMKDERASDTVHLPQIYTCLVSLGSHLPAKDHTTSHSKHLLPNVHTTSHISYDPPQHLPPIVHTTSHS